MKVWLVYTLLFGYPVPLPDSPEFSNETACVIYIGGERLAQVREVFKLKCASK